MQKVAVVTGAGSGVGQALAGRLAQEGWQLALVGRREATLLETAALCGEANTLVCPADVSDQKAVTAMAAQVLERFGAVELLVNSAGTNTPRRSFEQLSPEDYQQIMDINTNGAFWCVQAFLIEMRRQQHGTIINICSVAGLKAGPLSGVAYAMSKFGMRGLNEAINAEERQNGIRACAIYPGEINTPILDLRPVPPSPEVRLQVLQPEDVVACAMLAINLPARALVEEIVIRPR